MAALNERKAEIVRTLVETAPDGVLANLQAALAEAGADTTLADVRRLVETEARDRRLRNMVLQPIAPMCVGDGKSNHHLMFPARVLAFLWRGLKEQAPAEVADAAVALFDYRPGESAADPFDRLAAIAAYGVRERPAGPFAKAAEVCDAVRPEGAVQLAACLDLSPVVRVATHRLPEWIAHIGEETMAAARLAYRDAVKIADDAGPRFFEMLAAQMHHPWMILRIISAVMDRPTERYLADSEMAGFGERVILDIDEALEKITHLNLEGGPAAGRTAGKLAEMITLQTSELEAWINLDRSHGWGQRIVKQKKALASVVEARLRDAEKMVDMALPAVPSKLSRTRRAGPRLTTHPDPVAVTRAMTLLTFAEEVRSSANYGGFAAARGRMLENVGDTIDAYVEEVIEMMKASEVEDESIARAYLNVAAEFSLLVRDQKAADLVRRRAAVASRSHEPQAQAG